MEKELQIGKWYFIIQHGFTYGIKGKLIDIVDGGAILSFYWGAPFRTNQFVENDRVGCVCKKPSIFSNR